MMHRNNLNTSAVSFCLVVTPFIFYNITKDMVKDDLVVP